jgi:integrase
MSNQTIPQQRGNALGSPEWVGRGARGTWHAKISLPGAGRKRIKLKRRDGTYLDSKEKDRALAKELTAELAVLLRSDEYALEQATSVVETTEQFGERWTSGELYRTYGEVRRLKPKASASHDRNRLRKYVYPYIGTKPISKITEEEIGQAFARAFADSEKRRGKPLRPATKRHIYMVTHRLFDLAIKPGRLRTDNPVSIDFLPGKGSTKLFSFLYPDELLEVLGCEAVPLVRRVYYALASYTGLRKSSLRVFRWSSIDFEDNTILSVKNKTGVPLIFSQSDPLLPGLVTLMTVLRRYREYCGWPDADAFVIPIDLECKKDSEAETLRLDLKTAGITRKILFTHSEFVEALRFHDLRATFVTWARRAGKGDGWVADRTGHIGTAMMQRYDRGARSIADLRYKPFPDISLAIPELSKDSNVARIHPR